MCWSVRIFFLLIYPSSPLSFFFFNDTATTEIYTLSLHDALPISSFPTALHFAVISVLPDAACANYGADYLPAVMLCAGRAAPGGGATDTCHGDSGGP